MRSWVLLLHHVIDFMYFYSNTNYMHQYLKFILIGVTLYMFRTVLPSIIRSLKTVHIATGVCQILLTAC